MNSVVHTGNVSQKCIGATEKMIVKMEVTKQLSVKTTTHHKRADALLLKRKKTYFVVRWICN